MRLSAFTAGIANLRSIALNCLPHNFLSLRCVKAPFEHLETQADWSSDGYTISRCKRAVDLNQMSRLMSFGAFKFAGSAFG